MPAGASLLQHGPGPDWHRLGYFFLEARAAPSSSVPTRSR